LVHGRPKGEVFDATDRTVVVTVAGSDVYEKFGPTVVHHVDVEIGGSRPSLPVPQAPDDARKRFPNRSHP
jgi:hypothetical protein